MRRSAFHSVSYFITGSVISQIPKGIYFIEKSTCKRKCFFLAGAQGLVCIFALGEDKGLPPSSRRQQQSTGLLHL